MLDSKNQTTTTEYYCLLYLNFIIYYASQDNSLRQLKTCELEQGLLNVLLQYEERGRDPLPNAKCKKHR